MGVYLFKRLLLALPTLLGASIIIFLLIHIAPGDPVRVMLGPMDDPALRARLIRQLGLDLPLHEQYLRWLGKVLQGDLSISVTIQRGSPVVELLAQRYAVTLELAFLSAIVALLIAVPAGITSALRQNRLSDHIARIVAMVGVSVPNFFLGIMLILIIGVSLHQPWATGGFVPLSESLSENLIRMFLPAIALGTAYSALVMRMLRSSMLDVMSQDYVRTARAMGIGWASIVRQDIVKNALIPVITVMGNSIGYLLGGSIVTETIFRLPGIGRLIIIGVDRRDYPVIQGVVLSIVLIRIVINLSVDVLYSVIDPRIRYGEGGE
ncbi:MAG: ABC transporter permease [Chloroflexi bacterium]|nr:ABC transporter permease [Chloroflexota bacterium]